MANYLLDKWGVMTAAVEHWMVQPCPVLGEGRVRGSKTGVWSIPLLLRSFGTVHSGTTHYRLNNAPVCLCECDHIDVLFDGCTVKPRRPTLFACLWPDTKILYGWVQWVHKFTKKIRSHVKDLGARKLTWSKSHAVDPQILGNPIQNLVLRVIWRLRFCVYVP